MGYDAGKQAKQPRGRSTGEPKHSWGNAVPSRTSKGGGGNVAFTGPADRGGSRLQEKTSAGQQAKQPSGKGIGPKTGVAEHHKGHTSGGKAHAFSVTGADKTGHGYSGSKAMGRFHRLSGDSGAHFIGRRLVSSDGKPKNRV